MSRFIAYIFGFSCPFLDMAWWLVMGAEISRTDHAFSGYTFRGFVEI